MGRLSTKSSFVEEVAEDAEGEDRYCEAVAAITRVSASELRENFVVIF